MTVSNLSRKYGLVSVSISHTFTSSIQNNLSTCFSLSSLSYKFTSLLSTLEFKKPIVEIKK